LNITANQFFIPVERINKEQRGISGS